MAVHDDSIAAGPSAEALIAEIAPAMLEKLKNDGKDRGNTLGSFFLMVISFGGTLIVTNPDWNWAFGSLYVPILLGSCVVALVLPWHFKKRNVLQELHYRRQYGKWRWER